MYQRSLLLVLCVCLAWLSAVPAQAGPFQRLRSRTTTKTVQKAVTVQSAQAKKGIVRRAPCKMVNGQLVCPTK